MRTALRVLHAEHLALRSVVRVFMLDIQAIDAGSNVRVADLRDILEYIREFPNRIHHPKEDEYLFKALRIHANAELNGVLDRLEHDHLQEHEHIDKLETLLAGLEQGDKAATTDFVAAAKSYVDFLAQHMLIENDEVFPQAEALLSEDEWLTIDRTFAENNDPLVQDADTAHQYADLHRRILAMGAPPMGLN